MSARNPLVEELVQILSELREAHLEWGRRADAHRLHLIAHRMEAVSEGARDLDSRIELMAPLDDRRLELAFALGASLGLPRQERPPTISELAAALGSAGAPLQDAAKGVREAVQASAAIAERNRRLAESGSRVAEATVKALARAVTRSSSSQSAYDRAGARSTGVAVPVFQRAWKG